MESIFDFSYSAFRDRLSRFRQFYPEHPVEIIGKSCGGREIPAVTIGTGNEAVLFTGAFHGSEVISGEILVCFLFEAAKALERDDSLCGIRIRKVFESRRLCVVPRVNPDGCEIALHGPCAAPEKAAWLKKVCKADCSRYNANLRGVDINHNFPAAWQQTRNREREIGVFGPGPTRYGGPFPESEPETAALISLCRTIAFRHALAFHTQGRVIYHTFQNIRPKNARQIAEILADSAGYRLEEPEPIAAGGGFKDWFLSEFRRPAFTVEAGLGENPLPCDSLPSLYREVRKLMTLALMV